jgi:hypothetical protein
MPFRRDPLFELVQQTLYVRAEVWTSIEHLGTAEDEVLVGFITAGPESAEICPDRCIPDRVSTVRPDRVQKAFQFLQLIKRLFDEIQDDLHEERDVGRMHRLCVIFVEPMEGAEFLDQGDQGPGLVQVNVGVI